jgi:ABC-type nitrate/sulfonate/bicarbonate transport system permease component
MPGPERASLVVARVLPWVGVGVVLAVWSLVARLQWVNPFFLASPAEAGSALVRLVASGALFHDAVSSLMRILGALVLSVALGVPLGLLVGLVASVNRLLQGVLDFLRSTPPIIVYPLCLFVFGPWESSRIAVAVFGATTVIILNTGQGVRSCSRLRQKTNELLGARWHQVLACIIVFESLPAIIVGVRSALSLCIIIVTVTEMLVGATHGLGTRVVNAQSSSETPQLFALIMVIGGIGLALNKGFVVLEHMVVYWRR